MDEIELWTRGGLLTSGLGPDAEWFPQRPDEHQELHTAFWSVAEDMLPEDEDDEQPWMTQAASRKLAANQPRN